MDAQQAVKPLTSQNFSKNQPLQVLMVCMGNICRSPTAEWVLRHKLQAAGMADWVQVASAGTHNYHPGNPADARSARYAARRGYDLSLHRARQLVPSDFEQNHWLFTMDWDNQALTEEMCPPAHRHKVQMLMSLVHPNPCVAVPDPYYGGDAGFEAVLDMAEAASDALIARLQAR